jgi:hypothetical protein
LGFKQFFIFSRANCAQVLFRFLEYLLEGLATKLRIMEHIEGVVDLKHRDPVCLQDIELINNFLGELDLEYPAPYRILELNVEPCQPCCADAIHVDIEYPDP